MQKYAILSVSDKSGLVPFARRLVWLGFKILSTGGTHEMLKQNGVPSTEISEYTQSEEMFGGRVKTLHPKIHGGILHRRGMDSKVAEQNGIFEIALVCVNLYPFKETTEQTQDFDAILEQIDIGGPSMIRAAAKNFRDVYVVVDFRDYDALLEVLEDEIQNLENLKYLGDSSEKLDTPKRLESLYFRKKLMLKAFAHTAEYDSFIANYMWERFRQDSDVSSATEVFPERIFITGKKVMPTNYGENPHQSGVLYEFDSFYSQHFRRLKGEASFNNLTDMNAAMKIATVFGDVPCVCIIKHGNPCGFALGSDLVRSYKNAMRCDSVSAYGGVLAINGMLDVALSHEILKHYIEVIIAGSVSDEALQMFLHKKRIKIFTCTKQGANNDKWLFSPHDRYDFKHIQGGFVYQNNDVIGESEVTNSKIVSQKVASETQLKDLEIAYKIAALTKSNCITFVKEATLLAIGMGMTSRVDAIHAALRKAEQMGVDLQDSVMASEAFFPFKDSIELAAKIGVSAIIEPGGSIRDKEVIASADENNIALYFTGVRHFLH